MRSLVALLLLAAPPALAGDKDGDGVPNKTDQCKEQAEDLDGFQDADGCPDLDNDEDGLQDDTDKCPDEAEDSDGFQDEDGCPDPDNDEDGVFDADDKCPLESEDGEGPVDGCPEVGFSVLTGQGYLKSLGEITSGLLTHVGKQSEGCDGAAELAQSWLAEHNIEREAEVFKAQLDRAPEIVDTEAITGILNGKGSIYPSLRGALAIFCKDHPAWQEAQPQLDAVFQRWLDAAE